MDLHSSPVPTVLRSPNSTSLTLNFAGAMCLLLEMSDSALPRLTVCLCRKSFEVVIAQAMLIYIIHALPCVMER